MILVLLGTNPYPFDRLLAAIDRWAESSGEKVVAQTGHTTYKCTYVECHDFVPHGRIVEWVDRADVVVTQGGFGSLRDCLLAGKPTVAVPRMKHLGECQDEQIEVVEALEEDGRIIKVLDIELLPDAIAEARTMRLAERAVSEIPRLVAEEVAEALGRRRGG